MTRPPSPTIPTAERSSPLPPPRAGAWSALGAADRRSNDDLRIEPLRLWALVEYRDGTRRFEGVVRDEDWLDEPGGAEFPESRAGWAAAVGYAPPVDFPTLPDHLAAPS